MDYEGKQKSPYKGVAVSCLLLFGVPLAIFVLMYFAFDTWTSYSKQGVMFSAMALGFGTGTIFDLSCVVAGIFKGTFSVIAKRVATLISDLKLIGKRAFKWYFNSVKEDGIVFWIYLFVILVVVFLTVYGIVGCIDVFDL